MTHRALDISDAAPGNRVDQTIDWLLAGVLAFMPLALGVVQPWSETITIAAIAALALCLALRQTRRDAGAVWTWAYVPMLLFIAVAVIQLVPMPGNWIAAISPQTLSVKAQLLGNGASASDKLTFSFYPRATRHDLEVVLLAAAVFITVLYVYRTAEQVKRLLTALAIIGGLAGLLALAQYISGADKIYWTIPMPPRRRPNGPFVHYSHYAQFMNLSMGAALGLFLVRAKSAHPNRRLSFARIFRKLTDREYRFAWWLGGVMVIGVVTIAFSMSRGGMVSLLVALLVTIASLSRRQGLGGRKWLIGGVIVLASLGLLYFAFDKVSDRIATLYNAPDPTAGRAQIYKDVWQESFPRFPVIGMGLGTFEMTYPMFDRSNIASRATYADADWVQLIHEMGLAGLVLVLAFVAVIVWNYFRATRGGRPTICSAAFGLGFGLLAVIINSFSDYGQHLPAIACLSAVSCALLINLGRWKRPEERAADEFRGVAPLPARLALPLASLVALCWAFPQANAARLADQQWDQVEYAASRLEQADWAGTQEDYASLVSAAQLAVNADPGDANHRYWLSVYKWRSIDHPPPATQPSDDDDLAPATQPAVPDIDVSKLTLLDNTPPATQPTTQPAVADAPQELPPPPLGPAPLPVEKYPEARRIIAELMETRRLCPTFGPIYSVAGQIRYFALHDPAGADEVELGYQLTRDHPVTSYAAALVDGSHGDWASARQHFRRCLDLQNGKMIPEMVYSCLYRLNRPELVLEVVDDRLDWLCVAANCLVEDGRHETVAADACTKVVTRLKSQGLPADLRALGYPEKSVPAIYATAGADCEFRKEYELAVQYFQRALSLDYGNAICRYRLAECFYAMDRKQDALREAQICLRFDPNMGGAKRIIADVAAPPTDRLENN